MRKIDRNISTIEEVFKGINGYHKPYTPMKADLKGRVAIITGASGMIGGAAATVLAASGAIIAIWDIMDESGAVKVREINDAGGESRYYHVDVTDRPAMEAGVKQVIADFGHIDILYANAGSNFGNRKPLTEFDPAKFDINIDLNLNGGSVYLTKLVLPYMIAQGGGNIIFTSSVCGMTGLRLQCGYVASKFAISALTRSLALEYAKYNIRVNTLAPGSLPPPDAKLNFLWDTCDFEDFDKNFEDPTTMIYGIAAQRPAHPSEMAGIILYFASDDASYTTGQVICVDGGWTAGLSGNY